MDNFNHPSFALSFMSDFLHSSSLGSMWWGEFLVPISLYIHLSCGFSIDHTNVQKDRDNNFPWWERKGAMVVFPLYTIQEQTFGQGYRTNCGAIVGNILNAHSWVLFASCPCLSRISIPNFVQHQFWLRTLQELGYLLWFILISLIGCHVAENTNVSKVFLWFAMGHFDWPIIKKF